MTFVDFQTPAAVARDRYDFVARVVGQLDARRVLEIGVWRGDMAVALLERCPGIECYWMLDPWRTLDDWNKPANVGQAEFDVIFDTAMAATDFANDRRAVLRGTTVEKIDEIEDAILDLVYIDGDHTLRGITIDLIATWSKLRPGGVIIGDDFLPTIWQHGAAFEPTMVFPFAVHFAEAVGAPIYAVGFGQFGLAKPIDGARAFAFHDLTGSYPDWSVRRQLRVRFTRQLALLPVYARRMLRRLAVR